MEEVRRCRWVNPNNAAYVRYHDEQWGHPVREDGKLFEMLLLECFQAGLSWECILNKRENFRKAFDGFDAAKIVAYDDEKLEQLYNDPGIVRNKRKICAAVQNARVFLSIQREYGSFSSFLWGFTEGRTIRETGVTVSPLSDRISGQLQKRGMKFVGSTTVYAYLQAVGIIWGHEEDCFLNKID